MDPSYAQRYRDLASRHWWWRARNDSVREVVERLRGSRRDATILDIGCGDGVLFPFLSRFGEIEGIEPDASVVSDDTPWRQRIQIRPFDAFAPGRQYDLILMLDVLEHLNDPLRALRQVHDLLKDEGRLLLTVPAFQLLWTHHDDLNRHFRRYTKRELSGIAQGAGLQVLESWYAFHWLFFAKLVERARERVAGPSPPEEVPPERLNTALYRMCAAERWLTGRTMPFGSSLLAVIAKSGGARVASTRSRRWWVSSREERNSPHRVHGERRRNFVGQHFWARGYFVSTVGRDKRIIRGYIQNQEHEDIRLDAGTVEVRRHPIGGAWAWGHACALQYPL